MDSLFVDTSYFKALVDGKNDFHQRAMNLLPGLKVHCQGLALQCCHDREYDVTDESEDGEKN